MKTKAWNVIILIVWASALFSCSRSPGIAENKSTTPTAERVSPAETLLPHTFYYLGNDEAARRQVFRLERDGTTRRQVTSDPAGVRDYDVSQPDGRMAFVSNENRLVLVGADGSDPQILLDGGPAGPKTEVLHPLFSPDGGQLTYAQNGLNLYDLESGEGQHALESLWEGSTPGMVMPVENYWPASYSPDGKKLLLTISHFEGSSLGIYDLGSGTLIRLAGEDESGICYIVCNGEEVAWTADGEAFFSANSENDFSADTGGLWRVDAASGVVTTLIPLGVQDGRINLPDEPHLGPDGLLYFFFVNYPNRPGSRPARP